MTSPRVLAGRYRLEAELGHGTMGTVWDAYDGLLRRHVAIKEVTFPAGMPDGEARQIADRTLREARAIAALSHPHVVTVYDIMTLDSGPVIVMELMVARTLADILADGPALDDASAAVVGVAVADGLIAAHAAGITHRDVKPANVLVGDDGRIKLTDFGIARSVTEQTMTATGMVLGSPAYISPEVAAGRPASPAADGWGLGALLFAAVEGHPPFDKGSPIATMGAVVNDRLPPHPHSGRIAGAIDGLLVKDPARRISLAQAHRMLSAVAGDAVFPPLAPSAEASAHREQTSPGPIPPGSARSTRPGSMRPEPSDRVPLASGVPSYGTIPGPDSGSGPTAIPPPPWASDSAAALAPLPAEAPPPPSRRGVVALLAALVCLAAAGIGFGGVLVIAGLA